MEASTEGQVRLRLRSLVKPLNNSKPSESQRATDEMRGQMVVEVDALAEFKEGVALLKNGYPQKALVRLRRAFESEKQNPFYLSFLGLSIARADRKWEQAAELCEIAVQLRRKEAQFYLNLAEVYALAGRRAKALDTLDAALTLFGDDERLIHARSRVEKRRNPLLPFLSREHFLNRKLGKLRHRALKRLGKENI